MANARVLLVEDDPLQASITKKILQRTGYDVLWAQDGVNAIKIVKTSDLDIILLDVVMPGMDGYEVCRWLKTDEATRGIPVIMLTVKKDLSDKISGLRVGADDYLPKPYNELELNARIYASLRTKALQDELRKKNRQLEKLLTRVEHMAITDELTGLYNRRRFHEILTGEFGHSERYSSPLSLIMFDIDHFKRVNDIFGHHVGDAALKEFGNILSSNKRQNDTAARYGGEEFMLILPAAGRTEACAVAEQIRKCTEERDFPEIKDGISVSAGISSVPDDSLSSDDEMIRCADFALYRAKMMGRNRVETAEGKELKRSPQ